MDNSFKKLKKKVLIESICKSAVIGLSTGLFVAGALLLILWLCSVNSYWIYPIPSGIVSALLAGGLCFLILRPTDKKVAKRYDNEYGLDERLQTMVEFDGRSGDIIDPQRHDALEKLNNAPAYKLKLSRIWYYIVIWVLAVAVFVSGVVIPIAMTQNQDGPVIVDPNPGVDDPSDDDPAFEYDGSAMQAELLNLIYEVGLFDTRAEEKTVMLSSLQELDLALSEVKKVSGVKEPVFNAVKKIDAVIEQLNTFRIMSNALVDFDADLAQAVLKGFAVYKKKFIANAQAEYIVGLKLTLGDDVENAMSNEINKSAERVHGEQYPSDDKKPLGELLDEYMDGINSALSISGFTEGDGLYDSFAALSTRLGVIRGMVTNGGVTDSELWNRINGEENLDSIYRNFSGRLGSALSVQSYGCLVELYIRDKLSNIFNIKFDGEDTLEEMYPDLVFEDDPDINPDDPDNPGGNGGGAGDGEHNFGSNDYVYDPITGERVTFGTIFERYETAIKNGTLDENFPEDLKNYLIAYLNYLNNGFGNPSSEKN